MVPDILGELTELGSEGWARPDAQERSYIATWNLPRTAIRSNRTPEPVKPGCDRRATGAGRNRADVESMWWTAVAHDRLTSDRVTK
jgi:hypothetical protein